MSSVKPAATRRELGAGSAVLEGQHRDPEALVGASGPESAADDRAGAATGIASGPLRGNREPRLAQTLEDGLHEAAREVPGPDVRARVRRKLGIERQQIPDRGLPLRRAGRGDRRPTPSRGRARRDQERPRGSRARGPARTPPCGSAPRAERNASSPRGWALSSIARRTIAAPRSNSPVCTICRPRIPTASLLSGFSAIARSAAGPNAARSWRKKCVCASATSAN